MQPASHSINIRQDRDFGEVFNATFAFVKQNAGVLFKSVLFFVAPVSAIGAIFFGQTMSNLFSSMMVIDSDPSVLLGLISPMLFGFAFYVASGVLLQVVVLGVMRLYEERGPGQFTPVDALKRGSRYFLPVLGFTVLLGLAFIVSGVLNIIPCLGTLAWIVGIAFVGTRLSLTSAAFVLDDRSFGEGIRTSWEIVRPAFWQTFGILAVLWVLVSILGTIFQAPLTIFTQVQTITSTDPMAAFDAYASPWMVVYLAFATIAQQVLTVIPVVGLGIQYGNLSESVTQSGLMDRLSAFGAGTHSPEEGTV